MCRTSPTEQTDISSYWKSTYRICPSDNPYKWIQENAHWIYAGKNLLAYARPHPVSGFFVSLRDRSMPIRVLGVDHAWLLPVPGK